MNNRFNKKVLIIESNFNNTIPSEVKTKARINGNRFHVGNLIVMFKN